MSVFASTLAFAECQDTRFRINALSGELETPVVENLKFLYIIGDYLTLTGLSGILAPDFLRPKDILNRPGQPGTLIQRRRMLNTAFT